MCGRDQPSPTLTCPGQRKLPRIRRQSRERWKSKALGSSREGSLTSTTFWALCAIYILPHLTPATSWAGATTSMLTEETNSQRSCQLLQNTRLKQSYIRIWVQGNRCVYKLCHITLRRVNEKSPGSWRVEKVDQVKLRKRSCGFTSPVCQALPSSRGVMGRIKTMEIQDKRDRTCPSDPFQLQHSLTEIPPLARSLSNLKSWDLSGPWVELTSVPTDVRSEKNVRYTPLMRAGSGVHFAKKGMWRRDRVRKMKSSIFLRLKLRRQVQERPADLLEISSRPFSPAHCVQ